MFIENARNKYISSLYISIYMAIIYRVIGTLYVKMIFLKKNLNIE